jgi:hypothetical protein
MMGERTGWRPELSKKAHGVVGFDLRASLMGPKIAPI